MEKTNYMMTVDDVAQELGVSKQKGYRIIRQLNEELAAAGYDGTGKGAKNILVRKILYRKKKCGIGECNLWQYQRI